VCHVVSHRRAAVVQGWQGGDGSAPLTKVELQASRSHTKLKAKTFGKKGR
jgi:hypothetical protein